MKRPNPVQNESEIPILLYKRARPVASFFSDLAQENTNELCNQNNGSITTQSTKSTQTVSGDTTVTGSETPEPPSGQTVIGCTTTAEPPSGQTPTSEPPSSQTKKTKTRKSAHGWMGPVVEEMMIVGNRSNSVMRMINQFIITTGINKKLVSQTTIRNKMRDILLKKKLNHNVKRQTVIGCDARCDNTLTLKNQLVKEEHMTFVDKSGNYVDHKTLSNKKSVTPKFVNTFLPSLNSCMKTLPRIISSASWCYGK